MSFRSKDWNFSLLAKKRKDVAWRQHTARDGGPPGWVSHITGLRDYPGAETGKNG